jgi:hypothetical protein
LEESPESLLCKRPGDNTINLEFNNKEKKIEESDEQHETNTDTETNNDEKLQWLKPPKVQKHSRVGVEYQAVIEDSTNENVENMNENENKN